LAGFRGFSRTGRNNHKESKKAGKGKAPDSNLHAPPKMTMYIFVSHATLTGAEEKKTGPSRFTADFFTELTKLSKFRIFKGAYTRFTASLQSVYMEYTPGAQNRSQNLGAGSWNKKIRKKSSGFRI